MTFPNIPGLHSNGGGETGTKRIAAQSRSNHTGQRENGKILDTSGGRDTLEGRPVQAPLERGF